MGNNNSLSFLLGAALLCSSAAALATATVDYRHEYRLRDRTHYDKLGLSTTLPDNMFLGVVLLGKLDRVAFYSARI